MLYIECPYCGPREETEFSYGGEAHIARPMTPNELSDEEWSQYLFGQTNTSGLYRERWMHSAGCRRWFNAERDTVSYVIKSVYKTGEQPPGAGGQEQDGS